MKLRYWKDGDLRLRRVFAWLPIECSTGHRVWLEWVEIAEECYRLSPTSSISWTLRRITPTRFL
jgi:hypothetical protein